MRTGLRTNLHVEPLERLIPQIADMPLGIERLNARRNQPNDRIVFIKPLDGPDKATALDFLERIAAICKPIMKANHLAVMSLAEHEPNREFLGRNFNAGELIELVLKSHNGRWLSFRFVQMVMMHELAHCKQMNHGGSFWKVRNQFAGELRGLWGKGYSGDGFWSRGQTLYSGQYTTEAMPAADKIPEHLCGGTYRSSKGKRKRRGQDGTERPQLSYAVRKQKWIAKKFGAGGTALGDDEGTRVKLENGKKPKGKPRVAGSARGRELRAAAALARFDQAQKMDVKLEKDEDEDEDEIDDDSDYDEPGTKEEAVDVNGNMIVDSKGNGMVKICEDENVENDGNARDELDELTHIHDELGAADDQKHGRRQISGASPSVKEEDVSTASEDEDDKDDVNLPKSTSTEGLLLTCLSSQPPPNMSATIPSGSNQAPSEAAVLLGTFTASKSLARSLPFARPKNSASAKPSPVLKVPPSVEPKVSRDDTWTNTCAICSLSNPQGALSCIACAHVLNPQALPNHWGCQSSVCHGSLYLNSGDHGVCGVCGVRRGTGST